MPNRLSKLKVSRRFALRGAISGVGVSLWLPVLDAMCNDHGTAFAQGDPLPTTFGIWFWGNGIHAQYWTPSSEGIGDAWQLPTNLEGFSDLKDHVTLVTGLQMLDGVFKGHGWGTVYVLAGGDGQPATVMADLDSHTTAFEVSTATQYVPTIDQIVADALGANLPLASLETGVMEYVGINMGTTSENLAHRGPHDFLPPERDPRALFDRLVSNGLSSAAPSESPSLVFDNELRRSVLDAVLEDAADLRGRLGTTDAQRLDQHMENIRELEQRLATLGNAPGASGQGCVNPPAPEDTADVTERSQTIHRLLATALACNLTRVYTHLWSGARDSNHYPMIGINGEHHALARGTESDQELAARIEKYIMDQYADLVRVLRDTPIGASSLLDQTLIYGVSELSNPATAIMSDYHILLAGHAGGQLPGNMHLRPLGRKVTELMLTMLQTMGLPIQTYGSWDQTSSTIAEVFG